MERAMVQGHGASREAMARKHDEGQCLESMATGHGASSRARGQGPRAIAEQASEHRSKRASKLDSEQESERRSGRASARASKQASFPIFRDRVAPALLS